MNMGRERCKQACIYCEQPAEAHGLCGAHYKRKLRNQPMWPEVKKYKFLKAPERALLFEEVKKGVPVKELALRFGISDDVVYDCRHKAGFPKRKRAPNRPRLGTK